LDPHQTPSRKDGKEEKTLPAMVRPYRVTKRDDPDITAVKVYFPEEAEVT